MRKRKLGVVLLALLWLALALAGCTSAETTQPPATDITVVADEAQPATTPTDNDAALAADADVEPTSTPSAAPDSEATEGPGAAAASGESQLSCSLTVRCDTILANLPDLDAAKSDYVPADGLIFSDASVCFNEGETVFDVLKRALREAGIQLEFSETPGTDSAYIEGIANIYELDCGPLSGWLYRVNGVFPGFGCSQYQLQTGDAIEWLYTCDLGADVGSANIAESAN